LCCSAGFAELPDPLTGGIEGRSSPVRKAARSPVAVGMVTVFAMVLIPCDGCLAASRENVWLDGVPNS